MPSEGVGREISKWLGKLAAVIGVDRCSLWELEAGGDRIRLLYFYSTPGAPKPLIDASASKMEWLTEQYLSGNVVAWPRVPRDIPASAAGERAWARSVGAKSVLCIPMNAGQLTRSIVFTSVRRYHRWPEALIKRLRLVGEIFSGAITRQTAEASLQSSESRTRAILKALPDLTFILNSEGVYLDFIGDASQLLVSPEEFLGRRIDDVLPAAITARFRAAFARASVSGEVVEVEFELPVRGDQRVYEARIVRRDDDAVVCIVRDVTERTRALREVERLRHELTHFGRLALMGQLTSSLAHELAQPITAAVGNAEAGQRLLTRESADPDETRAILADVVDSCLRAAEVVSGVRSLLTKEPRPRRRVDLNRLVTEVAEMMHSDLIRRQVRLVTRLDSALPEITGHPVELRQVILNLILNGAEALSQTPPIERELVIATQQSSQGIELTVRDQGIGADPAHLRRMFEPFFTTKPDGIGMGLPICAEIVKAHSGRLSAENNPDRGITVRCLLPLPGDPPSFD